jgi:hypothetical protein
MASYVLIQLDITKPTIEISIPRYTTRDIVNEITISSNENLSNYQDIYIIDSVGNKHQLSFQKSEDGKEFVGMIKFEGYPYGMSTIYARLKDEVDNISDVKSVSFEIKESLNRIFVTSNDQLNTKVRVSAKDENATKAKASVLDTQYANVIIKDTDEGE